VTKLTGARPYRPLPPWQAIVARLFVSRPLQPALILRLGISDIVGHKILKSPPIALLVLSRRYSRCQL